MVAEDNIKMYLWVDLPYGAKRPQIRRHYAKLREIQHRLLACGLEVDCCSALRFILYGTALQLAQAKTALSHFRNIQWQEI